jgi:3-methyladenine DNA glycosylase AlkD
MKATKTRKAEKPAKAPADAASVIAELKALGSEAGRTGMARFRIATEHAFGVSMQQMKPLARRHRREHDLALALWVSGIHEARILAALVEDPKLVTSRQMDQWVADFDSWDICDQACMKVFAWTPLVHEKVGKWAKDEREFVRRAAFALIAGYAVAAKTADDKEFLEFLKTIEAHARDPRNFVRKAVNWALRQIGKRSLKLHKPALKLAEKLAASEDKTARWIGKDAVKELTDPVQLERLAKRA